MSRADAGPYELDTLPPFYFYVDEFQNFANESFSSILSEARKYNLALTVAHQYIEQMEDEVKAAVFGNVGTMIVFRVGATDAEVFEKEFAPVFVLDDIVNLSAHQIYLRLMIDGVGSSPFSAKTLDPIQKPGHSFSEAIIAHTRATYSKPRFAVEEEIASFYAPPKKPESKKEEPRAMPSREEYKGKQETRSVITQENGKRDLSVRKITDTTPLPPRYIAPRQARPSYEQSTKAKVYRDNRSIEEQFHKPPSPPSSRYESRSIKGDDTMLSHISTPTFDERPATSLKDALAKALSENGGGSSPKEELYRKEQEEKRQKRDEEEKQLRGEEIKKDTKELTVRKEVDEDTLRKLLEE